MSVSISDVLDAPIDEVWAIIADFANLRRWHPLVERTETVGTGEGAVRTVHFADWWATERLDRLDPGTHVLAYSVIDSSRPPTIGVSGSITLADACDGRTRITWQSGQQPDSPYAADVNAGLAAYYPARLEHLRQALRRPPEDRPICP